MEAPLGVNARQNPPGGDEGSSRLIHWSFSSKNKLFVTMGGGRLPVARSAKRLMSTTA
jgi:hypothetical protein